MDSTGTVTCPTTHVMNFTHASGNKEYETILSTDEAAAYTVANIFGTWAPDQIAAQVELGNVQGDGCTASIMVNGEAPAYLLSCDGQSAIVVGGEHIGVPYDWNWFTQDIFIRGANGRGGFGPASLVEFHGALNNLKEGSTVQKLIENGQVVILRDGVKYNTLGTVIR